MCTYLLLQRQYYFCTASFFFPSQPFLPILDMSGGAQTHLDNHLVEGSHYARSRTRYGHWVYIASPCYQVVIWGPKCVSAMIHLFP